MLKSLKIALAGAGACLALYVSSAEAQIKLRYAHVGVANAANALRG